MSRPRFAHSGPLFELAIGYLLILLVIWTPRPIQQVFFWTAFAWIAGFTVRSRNSDEELGFGFAKLRRAFWIIAIVFAGCAVTIAIAQTMQLLHPLFGTQPISLHVWGYLIWALLQQFVLQDFVLLRLIRITHNAFHSVLIAASLFAVAHLPNPILTVATLLWGLGACILFLRYRSLYVLAAAHWMLGLCIAITVPNEMHRHMRVGLGYLRDTTHRAAAIVPFMPEKPEPIADAP